MAAFSSATSGALKGSATLPRAPSVLLLRPTRVTVGRLRTSVAAPAREEVSTLVHDIPVHHEQLSGPTESQPDPPSALDIKAAERRQARQREQLTYQMSAIAASVGVTGLAILATYLRFSWHVKDDGTMPWGELMGTLSLVAGGVFFMEMYARFAHKSLWHDFEPGWALHKSHHMPRTGPFEDNDIFAVMNGVPAMALCLYGFLTPGMTGSLAFGAGLGITLFGIMYMFVHDGLVHRRFPVGPIAELPYLKRLAVAHQLHHAEKYAGAPWGMFLALQELDSIPGAREEVERMVADLDFSARK